MGSRRKLQKRNLFGLFLNAFALKYCQAILKQVRMGRGSDCQSEIKTAHKEMGEGGRDRDKDREQETERKKVERERETPRHREQEAGEREKIKGEREGEW